MGRPLGLPRVRDVLPGWGGLDDGAVADSVAVLCERPQTCGISILPLCVLHMCSVLVHDLGEQTLVQQRFDEPCGVQNLNVVRGEVLVMVNIEC